MVKAVDSRGLSAIAPWNLRIENFPRLNRPLIPPLAGVNLPFLFTVPYNTFIDAEGDVLSLPGDAFCGWFGFTEMAVL